MQSCWTEMIESACLDSVVVVWWDARVRGACLWIWEFCFCCFFNCNYFSDFLCFAIGFSFIFTSLSRNSLSFGICNLSKSSQLRVIPFFVFKILSFIVWFMVFAYVFVSLAHFWSLFFYVYNTFLLLAIYQTDSLYFNEMCIIYYYYYYYCMILS